MCLGGLAQELAHEEWDPVTQDSRLACLVTHEHWRYLTASHWRNPCVTCPGQHWQHEAHFVNMSWTQSDYRASSKVSLLYSSCSP